MRNSINQFKTLFTLLLCIGIIQSNYAQKFVVGYLPTYSGYPNSINNVDLDVTTHIFVAFANPDWNGGITAPNGIATVVNASHAKNVKVLLSICGAGGDPATYGNILSNAATTNTFVANLAQIVEDNNLDGIDVDIEGNVLNGNNVNAAQYEAFVLKLRDALHANGKLVTAALGTWFINHVTNTAAQAFDFIGMMSYDAYGTWTGPGQHSPYSLAVSDFNLWRGKGVAANKLIVGVPFYGYGWGNNAGALTYANIVNTYPGAENQDQQESGGNVIYYNGIPTIKQKTKFAIENAGGVMIWELTQDATGTKSLLNAIKEEMGTVVIIPVPDNLAKDKQTTASSVETTEFPTNNITDGLYSTRWASLYNDTEWIYVDLVDSYEINRVKITWESASAKDYLIQVSNDTQIWTTIKTVSNNNTLENDYTNLTGNGRYVRMMGVTRNTTFGYSIFEIEVYGKGTPKPYTGTPIAIPGVIEAENYDLGGEGVSYHDLSLGNTGNSYRTDDVDIEECSDTDEGFNLGYVQAGEWTLYSVNVTESQAYDFDIRVATNLSDKKFHIEIDDQNVTGSIAIPNTEDWQTWGSATVKDISLTSGNHFLKIVMDDGDYNINKITVTPSLVTGVWSSEPVETISVYPNPVSSRLFYELEQQGNHQVKIYTVLGDVIYDKTDSDNSIDVSTFQKGIYFFEVITDNKRFTNQFVIK